MFNSTLNKSVSKKDILIFLIVFISFAINITSPYLQTFNLVDTIYRLLQVSCFFFTILFFRKFDKIFVLMTMYYLIYFISTMLNGGSQFAGIIRAYIVSFNLLVLMNYYISRNPKVYFKSASCFFSILIIIEIITMLLYPDGLYYANNINPHYFLGHRNNTIEYLFPAIAFVFCSSIINNNKSKKSYLFLIVCIMCVFYTWSANSIVALLLTTIVIFFNKKFVKKIINYWNAFCASVAMFFAFIIFKIQDMFSWVISGILHRSLTFTGRTQIWEKSIFYIKKSIIYGYGNETPILKSSKIIHMNSCHNYFLDFLYSGGIIMLIVILLIVYFTGKKISAYIEYDNLKIKKITHILSGILAGYFIIWFATPVHLNSISYMFLIFSLMYNLKNLKLEEKEDE